MIHDMSKFENHFNRGFVRFFLYSVVAAAFCYYIVYFCSIIFNPYISEFREGHSFGPVYMMLNGMSPWSLDTYPEYYNSYGVVFSFIVYPFSLIFGNSLILHRVVNEMFWLLTIWMLLYYRKPKEYNLVRLLVILTLLVMFNYGPNITVRPDGVGTFLFTLTILIPYRNDYGRWSIYLAIVFALLAFYVKPYYILGWYLLSIIIFFNDKKKCIIYNMIFHLVFVIIASIVFNIFPLYFYETIFAYGTSVCNVKDSTGELSLYIGLLYSLKQYVYFIIKALPIFIVIFFNLDKRIIYKNWNFFFSLLICGILLFYPLGTNNGAFVSYHTQLLLPLLALIVMDVIDKKVLPTSLLLLCFLILLGTNQAKKLGAISKSSDWKKVESYVNSNEKIYISALIAPILMSHNKKCVDAGVAGFVFGYHPNAITTTLFGLDNRILNKKKHYIRGLERSISNQEYDVMMLTDLDDILIRYVDKNKYKLTEKLFLDSYERDYIMYIYKPICKDKD